MIQLSTPKLLAISMLALGASACSGAPDLDETTLPGEGTGASQQAVLGPSDPYYSFYTRNWIDLAGGNPYGAKGTVDATCPTGTTVVGGGFGGSSDKFHYYRSRQYRNGWRVSARNYEGTTKRLDVYAICARGLPNAAVSLATSEVDVRPGPPGNSNGTIAQCPVGSIATSGGFFTSNSHTSALVAVISSPLDERRWSGSFINNSDIERTGYVYATCLSTSAAPKYRRGSSDAPIPPNGSGEIAVPCKSKEMLTGGGWATYNDGDLPIVSSRPDVYTASWLSKARNLDPESKLYLRAKSVCLGI